MAGPALSQVTRARAPTILAAMTAAPPSLTAIILTYNEIIHIERAVASLAGLAQRIVVVDSGSSDGTVEKARELGAEVHSRAWVNYADQMQWALDNCAIATDWTMRLDADEFVGPDLVARLQALLPSADPGLGGIALDLRRIFMGRWIRFGAIYPLRILRIWRTGTGRIEQRWMDEHIVLDSGRIEVVPGEFCDAQLNDIGFFTAKHNGYATREAMDALIGKYGLFGPAHATTEAATSLQARVRRFVKTGIYNRLPLGLGPLLYFLYRYVLRLGFLDGGPGLIYHGLQGFWYRFLVDAKKYEFERALADCRDNDERIDRLAALTGHDLRGFAAARLAQSRPA